MRDECPMAEVPCPHKGCSEVIIRSKIDDHMQQCLYNSQWSDQVASSNSPLNSPKCLVVKEKSAPQPCCFEFLGCKFVGSDTDLSVHMEKDTRSHLGLVCKHLLNTSFHKQINGFNSEHNYDQALQLLYSKFEDAKLNLEQLDNENGKTKLQVGELESQQKDAIFRLNAVEDLLVTIQASITEINRTYEEVSLTLQTLQATSYKPNPNSSSFHRPKSDMNVASGCPKFAALSVLDNPEFIVDDVAFFQCVVNNK